MKRILLIIMVLAWGSWEAAYGQVSITNAAPNAIVDFSNTMQTAVGSNPSTAFTGAGFSPNPTVAGRLNSNAWEVKGFSFGDMLFGGTQTVDDCARGSVISAVLTPGVYAYTDNPHSVANPALMIQPGVGDFAPGTIALKIKNNGTSNLTQISVTYNLYVRNDENTSSSFNFSHSADNSVYVNEPVLDYTSPDIADAFQWTQVGTSPSRTCVINGLNIAPGGVYYIRWSSNLVSGTGDSDEFGLDDINITGTYGSPAPEINVTCYSNTLLSGDTTPTVAEGTEFAPSSSPLSTLLTTLSITYYIQNLGGLPLNVSGITITGAAASDFTISGFTAGNIAAASATISTISFTITFDPSAPGLRQARVNIANTDSNENPYWFDIQGYGIVPIPDIRINGDTAPNVSVITAGSMVPNVNNCTLFANMPIGGAGDTKTFAIRNDCPYNAPLILSGPAPYVTIAGTNPTDFTLMSGPSGNSINPGFKKQFVIKFNPTATGIRTALVTVGSDDPDENPYTFLVQGTGIAPEIDLTGNAQAIASGTLTTSALNYTFFDNVGVVAGTVDRTFVIINSGTADLTVGALTLTGANAADFSVVASPAATVLAGASTFFTIRFDPSATGIRNATVNLVNNDQNENPYTFAVSGYGLDYVPCAYATSDVLGVQDFETTPATPTWTYTTTGTGTLAAGTGYGATGDSGGSSRFLGARSMQVVNSSAAFTFAPINTTTYNVIDLSFRVASLGVTAAEGSDTVDRVVVSVSTDGTTWSNEMEILGNNNAKWSFVSGIGTATGFYDGNNILTTYNPGAGGFLTANGYSNIVLTNLPSAAALYIRISMNNNANEVWALDNVQLLGRKESSTTWNGSAWSAGAPTASVKAIIDGNYNTSANGTLNGCKCQVNAGRTLTVATGTYMDIQSEVVNSGTLTVEDGGTLIQRNDLAVNTGSINVKRYTTFMRQFDFTYWSSPVAGQTLYNLSPNTLFDKYYSFNTATGLWAVILNGASVMSPGKGYIVRAPQGFTSTPQQYTGGVFTGVPNNGLITTPITLGVSNMNCIGNPYPSAISANAFLSNAANVGVVEGTIYLWTHNTPVTAGAYNANDYAVYNYSGSVATRAALNPGLNNTVPNGFIASGQGFMIKGLANGVATFNNSMRVTGSNTSFFRPGQTNTGVRQASESGADPSRIWLNISNAEGAFKQTMVGYIDGASNGYDRGFDGDGLPGGYVNLYSVLEDKPMAIQGRQIPFVVSDQVPLGYSCTITGPFEISIESLDGLLVSQNVYLQDLTLGIIHDLKASPYTFETGVGTFNDRFVLRYENSTLANEAFTSAGNDLIITASNRQIGLRAQGEPMRSVAVFDLTGRLIADYPKVNAKEFAIPVNVSHQALMVKIVLENGRVVNRKIML